MFNIPLLPISTFCFQNYDNLNIYESENPKIINFEDSLGTYRQTDVVERIGERASFVCVNL